MRVLNSLLNRIIIGFLSSCTELITVLLLYAIFFHSPASMGRYKRMMLKMAITDILFSLSLSWLQMPDILFPLPGAAVTGAMKIFGPMGGRIANTFTFATCAATLLSVNDCCMYRLFVFFKMDIWLNRFTGLPGFLLCVIAHIVITLIVGIFSIFYSADYKELYAYAIRHNMSHLMSTLTPETSMIALDVDTIPIRLFGFFICVYLVVTEVANIVMSLAVQDVINKAKSSMSKETFRMQKSLTKVLLAQTTIPGISVTIPIFMYLIAIYADMFDKVDNLFVEWCVTILFGGYPLINSLFCFYFMKPYRDFLKKGAFWKKDNTRVLVIEASATSTME